MEIVFNFNTWLFIALFVLVISLIGTSLIFGKKIKKVKLNPLDLILGAFFLMALWLADLSAIDMAYRGFGAKVGVIPGVTMPALLLFGFTVTTMFIINRYYKKENVKVTSSKSYSSYNSLFIGIQLMGIMWLLLAGLAMIYYGATGTIFSLSTIGIYHLSLPFIIIPQLFVITDLY